MATRVGDDQIASIFYAANALDVEDQVNAIIDDALTEMTERLQSAHLHLRTLRQIMTDLVGDHCERHAQPSLGCPVCMAIVVLDKSRSWPGAETGATTTRQERHPS
jgi:hypothetical protein